jgi:hypothetical protein
VKRGLVLELLLVLALFSCVHIPAAGEPCTAEDAYCSSPSTALVCQSRTIVPFTCAGPKGCSLDAQRNVLCDQSRAASPGETCSGAYEGRGQCAADGASLLQCTHGSWAAIACPSGTTCKADGGDFVCR